MAENTEDLGRTKLFHFVEQLYKKGIELDAEGEAYRAVIDSRFFPEEIRINQAESQSEAVREAQVYHAVQYHYAHTAELVASGKLVEYGKDLGIKRVGIVLGLSHMSYVDLWGTYLARYGETAKVSKQLQEHFQTLLADTNAISLLIGLSTMGAVTGRVVMDATCSGEESVYDRLAKHIGSAKAEDEEIIADYLSTVIDDLDADEKQQLRSSAKTYREQSRSVILYGEGFYEPLGADRETVAENVVSEINEHFNKMGLTV